MQKSLQKNATEYIKRQNTHSLWKRIVGMLGCIVVFCTTYALILPAITMENFYCGLEEHTHSTACYTQLTDTTELICPYLTDGSEVMAHTHSDLCYVDGALVCGLEELEAHTHDETCYTLPEPHVHGDSCYASVEMNLICTIAETQAHTHDDGCWSRGALICTAPESAGHTHDGNCTVQTDTLICELEESEEHTHDESCYRITTTYSCGLEESAGHTHSDGCYAERVLTCTLEETAGHAHSDACYEKVYGELICLIEEGIVGAPELTCTKQELQLHEHDESCITVHDVIDPDTLTCTLAEDETHTHGDLCRGEWELICTQEEHTHNLQCYSDPAADVESAAVWEQTFAGVELTGNAAQDAVAIAKSQIGYTESTRNYLVQEDGETIKGYTRYGAWYGAPYGDWCAMFVSFCLNYADIPQSVIPYEASCPDWIEALQDNKYNLYRPAGEYTPVPGDLIFFDWEEDNISDHVGIVEEVADTSVVVIEGDSGNRVERNKYELHDGRIAGYGMLIRSQPSAAEDSVVISPEDADAWAVLVDPSGQIMQAHLTDASDGPEVRAAAPASSSTYAISKSSATFQNSARAVGTPLDLTPFIKAVTMYDEEGNVIESGSVVTEGDLINFKIEYSIDGQKLGFLNDQTVTVNSDTVTYKLPDTFKVIKSDSGIIINATGQTVGTYLIDSETNAITMTFSEDYVEQNAKGIQINGFISFFSTVTKVTDDDNENQEYKFTDEITLGVIIEENKDAVGDLTIEKKAVSVVGEEIEYELIVKSAEGTKGPVTITDSMSAGLTFKEGGEVRKGDGTLVNDARFDVAENNSSFTMTLPEMAAGESYTVRYKCAADIDLLDADMTARNTASVTGKDSQDHDLKDETTVEHTFDVLKKTGKTNDDGTITWTITINQAKADISGWVLEDIITTNAGGTPYTGMVTVSDINGNILYENVAMPITFLEGSKDTYIITYTTSYNFGDGDTISNKAILKDNNTEVTVDTEIGIGSPIKKSGTAGEIIQDENGKYLLPITWTVTIDTSGGEIPAGNVLEDIMQDWNSGEMYMTYAQLMAAFENMKTELNRVGSDAVAFEATEYSPGMVNSEAKYDYAELTGNVNGTHGKLYECFAVTIGNAIPQGNILTFTYQAYGVFENNVIVASVYNNQFNISGQYQVKGTVNLTSGAVKGTKSALYYYDPDVHGNEDWHWDIIHWNGTEGTTALDYEKLHDDYLAWAIELSVPPDYWGNGDIVIYEDLPEGVSVRGLTLPFRNGVPTSTLRLWDMVPGQTYSWNFYPLDQYGTPGDQEVSIVVKLTEAGDLEITIPGIVLQTMAQIANSLNETEWYGYLYIFTQINEDFAWTPTEEGSNIYLNAFENHFTIENENGDILDFGSQTQEITKDESTGVIRKEATTDENNIITYSVVLNAYGRDLIENAGTLSIHDELTYTATDDKPLRLRLVPGSIKLYEIDMASDGSYTRGKEVTANYSYGETSSEESGTTTWIHTIDLNVPDGKALLLEYSYRANGTANESYDVFNTCTINGVGEGGIDEDHRVQIEVKKTTAQADTEGVMLYKVDANSDGIFLENARFNIYIWNEEQNKYIRVHHPDNSDADFTTDYSGMIVLDHSTMDQFAFNTAYFIVEVESPDGYYLSPEPYYFQIVHQDVETYRPCLPDGFDGHKLTSGDIIYRKNVSNTTEITVEKYWQDYFGEIITVTGEQVSSVTLELWQMLQDQPDSAKVYGTYTMTPDEDGNWSLTITDLPKAAQNTDGTNYLYYIKEVAVNGYALESSENNEGINSGTIKLVNREQEGYELPQTGGGGTTTYTMAGLLLSGGAFLMYRIMKRRREGA